MCAKGMLKNSRVADDIRNSKYGEIVNSKYGEIVK